MGVAAYYRGNRSISRGICQQYGCHGCSACRAPAKPTPRPPDWGSKVQAKARKRALSCLRYMRRRGHTLTPAELADIVREDVRCGKKTAREAADHAFGELGEDAGG